MDSGLTKWCLISDPTRTQVGSLGHSTAVDCSNSKVSFWFGVGTICFLSWKTLKLIYDSVERDFTSLLLSFMAMCSEVAAYYHVSFVKYRNFTRIVLHATELARSYVSSC